MQKTANKPALNLPVISLLLLVCGYALGFNILSNTMDPIVEEFALTGASQGLMSSMMNLGSMLPLVILPLLQGRVDKRLLILLACVLQVLMLILTGVAGGFGLLLTACVLLGAGNNFTDTCANSYMVDLNPAESTRNLGLLHAFYGVGALLTPLLVSAIITKSGWRISYYVAAAIFALLILVFAIGGRKSGASSVEPTKETPLSKAMLMEYIRSPRNLLLLAASVFYAMSQFGLVSWVVRYTSVEFDAAQIGSLCLTAYWICVAICRVVAPRLPVSPGRLMVGGAAGAGIFHAIGVLSGSAVGMLIASALIGLVSGHVVPVMVGECAKGNEDKTSLTTTAVFLVMGLARMVIPLAMGAASASSQQLSMLLPAAGALLSALCAAFANRFAPRA